VSTFKPGDEVAVIQCDPGPAGKPIEGADWLYGTVAEAGPCSISVRYGDGEARVFMLDSRNRAWACRGTLRAVWLCSRCEWAITGEPAADGCDPSRKWCSGTCHDASAEQQAGALR
jgi:hypothetical protein